MEMLPFSFSVLGPPRAERGGTELPLGPPQQRAVLAALLLREGRPATVQELVGAVWGGDPPRRAVGALRTYASRLRRLLEPSSGGSYETLVSVGDGYALRVPPGTLDAAVFDREVADAARARTEGHPEQARDLLRSALDLWRGEPLAGVPGPYARAHRIRLGERRLGAVESRLELDLELGAGEEAVGELAALVARHPLRERLRGLLMLALHRAGRHAEALTVYAETRRTLIEELGIEPGRDLSDLHRRLLAEPGGPAAPVRGAHGSAGPRSTGPRSTGPRSTGRRNTGRGLRRSYRAIFPTSPAGSGRPRGCGRCCWRARAAPSPWRC